MKCPIKGVSKDCDKCHSRKINKCIYIIVWKHRQKSKKKVS